MDIMLEQVLKKHCQDFCKEKVVNWQDGQFHAVLDDNIGQLEFYEWFEKIKKFIIGYEDDESFNVFAWNCFREVLWEMYFSS